MPNTIEDVMRLEREFKACHKVLTAIGDETRQHLICVMLQNECGGHRVIDIAMIGKQGGKALKWLPAHFNFHGSVSISSA